MLIRTPTLLQFHFQVHRLPLDLGSRHILTINRLLRVPIRACGIHMLSPDSGHTLQNLCQPVSRISRIFLLFPPLSRDQQTSLPSRTRTQGENLLLQKRSSSLRR